jgi:hypothetical protein
MTALLGGVVFGPLPFTPAAPAASAAAAFARAVSTLVL